MIKKLIRKFIKNHQHTGDKHIRERYGLLGGILGIICNIIIFSVKIVIGIITSNMAVMSDAFDSLADVGSSAVSTLSAKMSNKHADKEHPFGHGRFEYVATLIISFLITLMGVQVGISAIRKLINGENTAVFNPTLTIILGIAVLIKIWMYHYNRYLGKRINSSVLLAASKDSMFDAFVTSTVIVSTIAGHYLLPNFPLDSVLGICVSVIIILNGVGLLKDTVNVLLGQKVDPKTIKRIEEILVQDKSVLGIHDLIVHDYGPGRKMASVHVEISQEKSLVDAHETVDLLEKSIATALDIPIVIHLDPVSKNCETTSKLRGKIEDTLKSINQKLKYHDLQVTKKSDKVKVVFDLVVPYEFEKSAEAYKIAIKEVLEMDNSRYSVIINIDYE